MTITIDDDSQPLTELLWVREAWGLDPAGDDLPPLLVDTPEAVGEPADRALWEDAWPDIWRAALEHAARANHSALMGQLQDTANGSPERAAVLHQMFGPSWRDQFGDDAFGESYRAWTERQFHARNESRPRTLAEEPERQSLDALIPAREAGLVKIITIPCRGRFTRRVGASALLVTASSRRAPDQYAAALALFARD
ncbi:hypothetical protein [Agromyces bauzanensis]|nr:hypothetical protein [Agromyces bauzanensis]